MKSKSFINESHATKLDHGRHRKSNKIFYIYRQEDSPQIDFMDCLIRYNAKPDNHTKNKNMNKKWNMQALKAKILWFEI